MRRIKPWESIPYQWWFFGIVEHYDGREFYFAQLRLPSYRWGLDPYQGANRWLQFAIIWHSLDGFSTAWLPCSDRS